jgi:rhomboid protease GluP
MGASKRQSLLCPRCRNLINADEPVCPYCGIRSPGAWWKRLPAAQSLFHEDTIIKTLIVTNVVFFVISLLFSGRPPGVSGGMFGLLAPSNQSLVLLGATGTMPIDQLQRWWSLISASYLHGGLLHLFFNMAALNQMGYLVVHEYGVHRLFVIYTLGGALGFLVSYLAGIPLTIGASASLCALVGALLYYGKSRGGVYGQIMFKQLAGWTIGLFLFGFLVPGINNWGHGGGLLGGALLGFLLGYRERRRETEWHRVLSFVCVLLTVGTLLWALISACYYRLVMG